MSGSQTPEPGTERALRSSVRNPRRRQRQSDTESLKTAPRRKRSKISEDTFVPPRHEEVEEVNDTIEVAAMNGTFHSGSSGRRRGRPRKESPKTVEIDIPMRGKRNSVKRATRTDGATVLTQNERYSVKTLPSTPKELRKAGVEYRGSLGAGHHALAITKECAFIWDYTLHAPVHNPRVFDVPFSVSADDPLPFGALVTSGTSTDIGLVLVSATTGKMVYYESIERAASLSLFQERNLGVEGTLGSLFSGETVQDLVLADHAGFIIILSSGRLAQLTLKDAQGKPRVLAQFLRATEQSAGGFLGGIKGLLSSGAWKRDVAAVRTRPLGTKGQMQAISLTERAELQVWDLDWTGQSIFKGTVDFKEVIAEELKKTSLPEIHGTLANVTVVDFAILDKPTNNNEIATLGAELPIDLLLLVRTGSDDNCEYVLVDMSVEGASVLIGQTWQLFAYQSRSRQSMLRKPRLVIPKPKHTALVAFDDAVVLADIVNHTAIGPEAQLQTSYLQPVMFEEAVYLRRDKALAILGTYEEEGKGSPASAIAFVKGSGLVRISVIDPKDTDLEERIPVKSKIEQAVFHGSLQEDNILDFSRVGDSLYPPEDIKTAALSISQEILRSTSSFFSTDPTSVESHLVRKSQALEALGSYVRLNYPTLSRSTMWRLMWDAERVAAALQMWKAFEKHVESSSKEKRTATVLDEVCALLQQDLDSESKEVPSDDDVVRTFFIHSLHRIEKVLPMICTLLRHLETNIDKPPETKIRLLVEADDLWNTALETVFAFRTENAEAYGILPEFLRDGVLQDVAEYSELPEFWTSTETMLKAVRRMPDLSRKFANDEWEASEHNAQVRDTVQPMILDVNLQNPRLVQSLCLIYQERINWLASRQQEKDRHLAVKLREHYEDTRYDEFRALASIAQSEAGMRLAEKYKDMHTLTEMVVAELQFALETHRKARGKESQAIVEYIEDLTAKVGRYFRQFGDDWANAYFDEGFSGTKAGLMLRDAQLNWQDALTRYLRAEPSRAKICWINDLTTAKKDFSHAAESLMVAAETHDESLWATKVELSLAKLGLLAEEEASPATDVGMSVRKLQKVIPQGELEVVHIQELLFRHMLPEIRHCIDRMAEEEVAQDKYCLKYQDLYSLKDILVASLNRVLNHTALQVDDLIDALTLMQCVINAEDDNLQGQEFFFALKALNAVAQNIPQDRVEMLLQLIWKRCYVYDDWVKINGSGKLSEDEISATIKKTATWRTMYYLLESGLSEAPDSHVRLLRPAECLGAGCTVQQLSYRFPDNELLEGITKGNKVQDEELEHFLADRRLEQWTDVCIREAQKEVQIRAEYNAETLELERQMEASLLVEETNGNQANGHINGANGTLKELGADFDASFEVEDGIEDIVME